MIISKNLPTLGILGGGQLARMLAHAANQLGCVTTILDPDPLAPALGACARPVLGDWRDDSVLSRFAASVDVLTLENEFVAAASVQRLVDAGVTVRPGPATLESLQDKLTQRHVLAKAGLPVPAFSGVRTLDEVRRLGEEWQWPIMLKLRCHGYDGKGNALIRSATDLPMAWTRLGNGQKPVYAEAFCRFTRELAVIVVRAVNGTVVTYPVVETVQENHVCRLVRAPASISPVTERAALEIARRAVEAVDGVGAFGVELFQQGDDQLIINEVAPRVHNSGHYTIEACVCSQFENHVRAVLDWPLGATAMRRPAATMVNLFGSDDGLGTPIGLESALAVPGAHVHVYGKSRSAPGRKMGHVTALGDTLEHASTAAGSAAAAIRFGAAS